MVAPCISNSWGVFSSNNCVKLQVNFPNFIYAVDVFIIFLATTIMIWFSSSPNGAKGTMGNNIIQIHVTHNMKFSLYASLTWWHINTIRGEHGYIRMGFTLIGSWSRKVGVQNTPSWTSLINSILNPSSKFGFSNWLVYLFGVETNKIWAKSG